MISTNLRILLAVVGIVLLVSTFRLIRKGSLPVKYSLFWIAAAAVLLLVGAVPEQIGKVTRLAGFEATSSLVIGVLLFMLLVISLILTLIVSRQKKIIILLVQEISILKKGVEDGPYVCSLRV